jgi:hypothetical protein
VTKDLNPGDLVSESKDKKESSGDAKKEEDEGVKVTVD